VIVSSELFDAVQREIERRASTGAYVRTDLARFAGTISGQGHRVATRHVLSGFLECGVCGGAFHAANSTGRYGCAWHRKRGPAVCESALTIPRKALEERIFSAIRERILLPEVVTYAAVRAAEEVTDRLCAFEPVDIGEEVAEIDAELATHRFALIAPRRSGAPHRRAGTREEKRDLCRAGWSFWTDRPRPSASRSHGPGARDARGVRGFRRGAPCRVPGALGRPPHEGFGRSRALVPGGGGVRAHPRRERLPALVREPGVSHRWSAGGRYVRDEPVPLDEYAPLPWAA
jgi:hypothetical protein